MLQIQGYHNNKPLTKRQATDNMKIFDKNVKNYAVWTKIYSSLKYMNVKMPPTESFLVEQWIGNDMSVSSLASFKLSLKTRLFLLSSY